MSGYAGERSRLVHNITYAAPEIIKAAEASKSTVFVDPATDVWAVGLIALEMVTGERLFPELPQNGGAAEAERVCKVICDCIRGRREAPWEHVDTRQKVQQRRSIKRTVSFHFARTQPRVHSHVPTVPVMMLCRKAC
jgi:serine/threonine protein kinase